VQLDTFATGHFRLSDCYNVYMRAVFQVDLGKDSDQSITAASKSGVVIPGCNGLSDLVWNIEKILAQHTIHMDPDKENASCLSGVLCIMNGLQAKKKKSGSARTSTNDPKIMYSVNALVDGDWGMMAAGNTMVLARGVFELFNRLAHHVKDEPLVYRDVYEALRKDGNALTEMKKEGGSYIGTNLRDCLKDRLKIDTALEMTKMTGVSKKVKEHYS
jgi:hypothetical protein